MAVPAGKSVYPLNLRTPKFWLLLFFAVLGLYVQYAVRLDYGPDEPYHVEYAYSIAMRGRLPSRSDDYLVQHPPLPYLPMALAWRAVGSRTRPLSIAPGPYAVAQMTEKGKLGRRLLRLVCLLECLGTLWILFLLARELALPAPWQWIPAFLAIACPMFEYMGGIVNNESASIFISSWMCLLLVSRARAGTCTLRQAAWIGLWMGICPWVKQTALLAAPAAAWTLWTTGEKNRRWMRLGIAALIAIAAGCGWPLHNILLTGQPFPVYVSPANQPQILPQVRHDPLILLGWLRLILTTGVLPDWSWRMVPPTLSEAVALLTSLAALFFFFSGLRDNEDPAGRQIRAMSLLTLVLLLAGILQYCVFKDWRAQIGGRYLLNGIAWLAALIGSGLASLLRRRSVLPRPPAAAYAVAGFILLLDWGWWYLAQQWYAGPNFPPG